jgi:hypothetical protein
MKTHFFVTISICLLLAACAPASTSTPTVDLGTDALTVTPTLPSTAEPSETITPTSFPEGRTITITSTDDSGPGTLREALEDAQPYDTIIFDPTVFPPEAPGSIMVLDALPQIQQDGLRIDASDAGVILDGSQLPRDTWIPGLEILSDGNVVRGLMVTYFTGTGLAVAQGENNTIGGDRSLGQGPLGQGNQCINNNFGIGLWDYASNNLVTGNLVGTDLAGGSDLGNWGSGVWVVEGGRNNTIGPDNIIAFNHKCGIAVEGVDSLGNTFSQNSIHDNGVAGICIGGGANANVGVSYITEFDITAGLLKGTACANCTVEIYSDSRDQGAVFEGQTVADEDGVYTFNKGAVFTLDNITATTTDADGNTSQFSRAVGLIAGIQSLQDGNNLPKYQLLSKPSSQLPSDIRLGAGLYSSNIFGDMANLDHLLQDYLDMGIRRLDTSMQEIEEPIDWSKPEFHIYPEYDRFIDDLNSNGIAVNYMLHFWDKDRRASGEQVDGPRFKTEEQIQDFLEYVRFIVGHFKGRVQYYTLWSEPDACGGTNVKCIEPLDYIELARRTIPVIHEEDPQAKVVTAPNVLFFDLEYLLTVLRSDVGPMFDAVSWHGIYDVTPDNSVYGDYYDRYPSILQQIKDTASANGLVGEFWGTEITYCSEEFPSCHPPEQEQEIQKTDKASAKYYARLFVIQMGLDVGVGWGGLESTSQPWTYPTIRRLNTVMAGTRPTVLDVEIENEPPKTVTYAFTLPNGDLMFALWINDKDVEDAPGVPTTLRFSDLSAQYVEGIDVLNGYVQELTTEVEGGSLVINDLIVRDYPIFIRLSESTSP